LVPAAVAMAETRAVAAGAAEEIQVAVIGRAMMAVGVTMATTVVVVTVVAAAGARAAMEAHGIVIARAGVVKATAIPDGAMTVLVQITNKASMRGLHVAATKVVLTPEVSRMAVGQDKATNFRLLQAETKEAMEAEALKPVATEIDDTKMMITPRLPGLIDRKTKTEREREKVQ